HHRAEVAADAAVLEPRPAPQQFGHRVELAEVGRRLDRRSGQIELGRSVGVVDAAAPVGELLGEHLRRLSHGTSQGDLGVETHVVTIRDCRAMGSLDPAALQVLIARLTGIADEMGAVLRRAAFSPNIKERADCSAALFTADGELLVQAEHIPVHLGSMPASVAAAIATGLRTEMVLNDPFAGGTHLNDVTMVAPVMVDGALVGWAANPPH